jgi:hypothetical protein
MSNWVSRADLARLLSVSPPYVTKKCQGGWAPACRDKRVDLDHPVIAAALAAKGVTTPVIDRASTKPAKRALVRPSAPTAKPEPAPKRRPKPTSDDSDEQMLPPQPPGAGNPDDIAALNAALRPLKDRFGSVRLFRDWLSSLKDIEMIEAKHLDTSVKRGAVYPRDFVHAHVYGLIDGGNKRLLGDLPKTLCREIYALARTGRPLEESERLTRKLVGKQLQNVRNSVDKAIKSADDAGGHSERPGQPLGGDDGADRRDGATHAKRVGRK